jgi:hypothetical protein
VPTTKWFEELTGFPERDYELTRSQLSVDGDELVSTVNGKRYGIGQLSTPTLAELRDRITVPHLERTTVSCVASDVGVLHEHPELEGALFQVASQFNLLEMTSPRVVPEQGVAIYANDPTQGPACAIAAGAATIFRNYFVPLDGRAGQTRDHQLNMLAPMGLALSERLDRPVSDLWSMRNGYALCTPTGLTAITDLLGTSTEGVRDALRATLQIGLHRDVEVTRVRGGKRQRVSQALCSGLPVNYSTYVAPKEDWEALARLVLEAAYEATLLAAVEQATAGTSSTVMLTRVGGGAFGNADAWVDDAIVRALRTVEYAGLDVRLVSYGQVERSMQAIADHWAGG